MIKTKENFDSVGVFKINVNVDLNMLSEKIDFTRIVYYKYLSNENFKLEDKILYDCVKINDFNITNKERVSFSKFIKIQNESVELSEKLMNKIQNEIFDDEFYELFGSELRILIQDESDEFLSLGYCMHKKQQTIEHLIDVNKYMQKQIEDFTEYKKQNEKTINELSGWDFG